jgi:HAD superfamily hydrolase (TIGR01509 family)
VRAPAPPPVRRAFLYDFDGLLVDSETAGLVSWRELYQQHDQQLDEQWWRAEVAAGRGPCMPRDLLEALVGPLDWDTLEPARLRRRDELLVARPGVLDHLRQARRHGLRLGVVSNAPDWWIEQQLPAAGLRPDWFDVVVTKSPRLARKPAPDAYLCALAALQLTPPEALAFEDSPVGVAAARAAGLTCVAVPNDVTRLLDLTTADLVLDTIDDLPVPDLVRRRGTGRPIARGGADGAAAERRPAHP